MKWVGVGVVCWWGKLQVVVVPLPLHAAIIYYHGKCCVVRYGTFGIVVDTELEKSVCILSPTELKLLTIPLI